VITLLARWILNAAALLLVAYLLPGVTLETIPAALVAALVLGLVNATVRPILVILTLPVTVLTLGLFIFVINALLFWFTAEIVHGFKVSGFWWAMAGSVLYSVITIVTSAMLRPDPS
jgi:putative membrane protein